MKLFGLRTASGLLLALLVSGMWVSFSQTAPGTDLTSAVLLQYLNRAIGWYRQLDLQRQIVTDSDEASIVNDNQQIANQVVSLAFDFARAEAESIEKEEAGNQGATDSSRYRALRQMLAGLDQQVRANQLELESLRQKLASAAGRQRESLPDPDCRNAERARTRPGAQRLAPKYGRVRRRHQRQRPGRHRHS